MNTLPSNNASSVAPVNSGSPDLRFIREDVKALSAYHVQSSKGMIKLDAMENPFVLPHHLQTQLASTLATLEINRYPGTTVEDLKAQLSRYVDLPPGYDVMLGNGSDELISLLALSFMAPGAKVLAPEPGFVMYAMSSQLMGLPYIGVPLRDDFELDEPKMLEAIELHQPRIVYLAYPNNPTANLWSPETIKRIISQVSAYAGVVVMDEAYSPFSGETWLTEMRADPHANAQVILMRTLSKFGLAGARLGYMVAPTPWVQEINKVRPPYNVSVLNAACASFALDHEEEFRAQAALVMKERDRLFLALKGLDGLTPYPSQANMMLVRVQLPSLKHLGPDGAALAAFEGLKARGILVKNVSKMHPTLSACLRLTVGTHEENTALIDALTHMATEGV
jgi:histidinol-phosphate aminotransferase